MAGVVPLSGAALVFYFSMAQFLVYMDRALLSGLLPIVEAEFAIDGFQSGLLGSGFMGGFMLASPFAALLAGEGRGPLVIGVGLLVWTLSAVASGLAPNYAVLLTSRILAGAGEAAYCSLAPPMIDDATQPAQRACSLAVYFSGIFVGLAVGFLSTAECTTWDQGRLLYFAEAAVMAPMVVYIFTQGQRFTTESGGYAGLPSMDFTVPSSPTITGQPLLDAERAKLPVDTETRKRFSSAESARGHTGSEDMANQSWLQQMCAVLLVRNYSFLLLGYSAAVFSIGGFAFWAPTFLEEDLFLRKEQAMSALSIMTGISGIGGTLAGGRLLDMISTCVESRAGEGREARSHAAVLVCFLCSIASFPCIMVAANGGTPTLFFAGLGSSQFFLMMLTAPANIAMMDAVAPCYRGLALGVCTMGSHLMGDVLSPVLVGKIRDASGGSLVPGVYFLGLWTLWIIFFWSFVTYWTSREAGLSHPCGGRRKK